MNGIVKNAAPDPASTLSQLQDRIVDLELRNAELCWQIQHDPLTGLLSRAGLHALWAAGKYGGIAMIDLNGFKDVNDRHGHAVGDLLLKSVAFHLAQTSQWVARLSGDEFVAVIQQPLLPIGLLAAAERDLIPAIAAAHAITAENVVYASASMGVAPAATDLPTTLWRADIAMYHAKRQRIPMLWCGGMDMPTVPQRQRRRIRNAGER